MKKVYLIDFDGTITVQDTLQWLLDRYGMKNWREIEQEVEKGLLKEKDVYTIEMKSLKIPISEAISEILKEVQLRNGFFEFYEYCQRFNYQIVVVSAGFRQIIIPFLNQYNFQVKLFANELIENDSDEGWSFYNSITPLPDCEHSLCKCVPFLEYYEKGYYVTFIGDGITDYCIAKRCEQVYALKGSNLEKMLEKYSKKYFSFNTFLDVLNQELKNKFSNVSENK
ncbi:MAG: MtnX-like HAD-IB family phosphatase [bacterium]|nr:MtnX-like HAD-IB family phosphatase [bacterium]